MTVMGNINHHLTDALLMSYAAGTLEEGFGLVVATHVSLCDECRARLESFEAVGGALVDACETAGDLDAVNWRPVGGGVKQAVLDTDGGSKVRLLSIPGGASVPDHGHRGLELTMVLKGAFRDEDGTLARGDVEVANEDLHHTPVAVEGEECICLAATDAPLRFKGLLPRMVQPFVGI